MKETKKQIKAQLINDIKKQYNQKLEHLTKDSEYWRKRFFGVLNEKDTINKQKKVLEEELIQLKEKVKQYEDWIERMQDFCNLPEEKRQKAFINYLDNIQNQTEKAKALNDTLSFFNRINSLYYNI